jgi:hypothetical protein
MVATGQWSLDGLALGPTTIQAIRVPESDPIAPIAGTNPSRLGLLGTDVLSRYRAVVLGFYANHLILLGP